MKFECSSSDLFKALTIATKSLPARSENKVLDGVFLKTVDNSIFLHCSDGNFAIETSLSAVIHSNGSVVLPAKLFREIVQKLPEGIVTIEVKENYITSIRCNRNSSTLIGFDAASFPQVKDRILSHGYHFPQKNLKNMIQKVMFAIALNDSRQVLTGCLMELTTNELRLVGLDGFKLSVQSYKSDFVLQDGVEQIKVIIPGHIINEVASIMTGDNEMVTFHFDENRCMITMGETTIFSTLLAGKYIDYRQLIPSSWLSCVKTNQSELKDALDRAGLIAKEGKNNIVRLEVVDDNIIVSASSEVGDVVEKVSAKLEGEAVKLAFNNRYISEVIKNVDDEEIKLLFNSSMNPCVISSANNDDYLYLVLPVRVH